MLISWSSGCVTLLQESAHLQPENVAIANALQLKAVRHRASRSGLLLATFILHMLTICYFPVPFRILTSHLDSATYDFLKDFLQESAHLQPENVAIANSLQLKAVRHRVSRFELLFLAKFILHNKYISHRCKTAKNKHFVIVRYDESHAQASTFMYLMV